MISWPYTKLMNSNNMVDQGAALILTSAEKATHLQISTDRWVFPYAGTDAHDTYLIGERAEFDRSPAIRIAGTRALELAGIGIDDVDLVDVYSCFPSAVQIARQRTRSSAGRPRSSTDGHRRSDVRGRAVEQLRVARHRHHGGTAGSAAPGASGLVTANGGLPHQAQLRPVRNRAAEHRVPLGGRATRVDAEPTRVAEEEWTGVGTVETWTTPFSREGAPEKVFVAVRTPDETRALAVLGDASEAEASVREDIAGAKVRVHSDGTAGLL